MLIVYEFCSCVWIHEQSAQEKEEHVTNATSDVAEEAKGKASEAKDKAKGTIEEGKEKERKIETPLLAFSL